MTDIRTPVVAERAVDAPSRAASSHRTIAFGAQRAWTALAVLLDSAALVAAAGLAAGTASGRGPATAPAVAFALLTLLMLAVHGFYRRRLRIRVLDGIAPFASSLAAAGMGSLVVAGLVGATADADVLRTAGWSAALLGFERVAMAGLHELLRRRGALAERTLVLGAGEVGARVAARLADHPSYGLLPVGFLDADPPDDRPTTGLPVLGGPADLPAIAPMLGVRHVIVAFSAEPDRVVLRAIRDAQALGLRVSLVPRFFDALNDRTSYEAVSGLPLLGLRTPDPSGVRFLVKHAVDRAVAAVALLVLSPLLLAIALGVRLSSPGPVLFRQLRVGRDGREFQLLKFRSMASAPAPGATANETWRGVAPGGVEGADRRTRLGRLLRRASLDELPQLLNVVRGEMSLVGPRPERPDYVELFEQGIARYGERHRVKGGMTGWAQVHGLRGQTSLAERIELDNWYIEHWSLALDLKVLLKTALAVLRPAE